MKRNAGSKVRIAQLNTPLKPEAGLLPFVPATRSMAEVERMLDAVSRKPVVPRRVLERIAADNKKDVYDKWIAGELT
jgi:hypothetical protein